MTNRARQELQWEMLGAVLTACSRARHLAGIVVVTADSHVAGLARAFGAHVVDDHVPPRGMNEAVILGIDAVDTAGADAALVITADLPLLSGASIDAIIEELPGPRSAVLAASRDGTGTNAMLLCGPRALTPQLGLGSLERHVAQAQERRIHMVRLSLTDIALDIDTPDDFDLLERCSPEWSARISTQSTSHLVAKGGQ